MRDRLGQQGTDVIVVQRIDHLPPVALAHHKTEVAEDPQLLRDGRLSHLDLARELADRARARTEATQDPHPARGRERLHRLRDRSRGLGRQKRQIRL